MNPIEERWQAFGPHVALERTKQRLTNGGILIEERIYVAFNVGEAAAQHIVDTHNAALQQQPE